MKFPIHLAEDGRVVHDWVRQSSIKTSDMCLERWRRELWDDSPEIVKDAAALGTACHSVAEYILEADEPPDEAEVTELFNIFWAKMVPTINIWNSYDQESATVEGLSRILSWYNEVYEELVPKKVEWNFNKLFFEDDERIVYLSGTVDLVEEDRIWDWKFPKRDYSRDKWQYDRWDVQSMAYCWATGIPNFSYAVMHSKGVGRMDLVRDESHTDWLRAKVLRLCQLLESDSRAMALGDNGWWCSEKWCDYFAQCKGATIGGT